MGTEKGTQSRGFLITKAPFPLGGEYFRNRTPCLLNEYRVQINQAETAQPFQFTGHRTLGGPMKPIRTILSPSE